MKVFVRDRQAEAKTWGSMYYEPAIRALEIKDTCPKCGGPRGTPKECSQYEDGWTFTLSTWTNPCGHTDDYADVIREFEERDTTTWGVTHGALKTKTTSRGQL